MCHSGRKSLEVRRGGAQRPSGGSVMGGAGCGGWKGPAVAREAAKEPSVVLAVEVWGLTEVDL